MKQEHRRQLVRDFLLLNPNLPDKDVVQHFQKEGMARSTIYNCIKRIKDGKDIKKSHNGGKLPCVLTNKIRDKLIDMFDGEAIYQKELS